MANHVYIYMNVTGSEEDIKRFIDKSFTKNDNGKYAIDFNKIKPAPWYIPPDVVSFQNIKQFKALAPEYPKLITKQNIESTYRFIEDFYGVFLNTYNKVSILDSGVVSYNVPLSILGLLMLFFNSQFTPIDKTFLAQFAEGTLSKNKLKLIRKIMPRYEWERKNWGESFFGTDFVSIYNNSVNSIFSTAWSFPTGIYRQMLEDNPNLSFHIRAVEEGGLFVLECIDDKMQYYEFTEFENPFEWAQEIIGR